MAVRTVSQSGNLSNSATFGGSAFSNGDSIVNDAGNGYTLTIDQNATVAGFSGTGGNGATTVNGGVTLTLTGNVVQGNANFTLSAGAAMVFDCTAADRKFLFGDTSSFSAYANCKFVTSGTSGSHCTVSKSGGNYCWFDCFSENSGGGADKTGYDCTYCDFTNIGKSDGSLSLGVNTFGNNDIKFDHCTFSGCGEVLKNRPYTWGGGANKHYYLRDCSFTSSSGSAACYVRGDSSGTGTKEVVRCCFDKTVNFNAAHALQDNLFLHGLLLLNGTPSACERNLFRIGNGDSEQIITSDADDCYWLANLDHPGNPHCLVGIPTGKTITGWIFEYPIAQAIDGGECVYISGAGVTLTVTNNLALPSETDGYAIGNMAHAARSSGSNEWVVEHNTVVGRGAIIAFSEAGADPTTPLYSSLKSNLAVDLSNNDSASIFYFNSAPSQTWDDFVDPADAEYNGKYEPLSYTDPNNSNVYSGYYGRFSSPPGANDITADPQFVDSTRNFANWSVYKGAASGGDSLATRTSASIALLTADPTLLGSDLMPWVRGGFAPTNAVYQNAGHDSVTIGAVEGVFESGNRRRRSIICGAMR